MNNVDFWASIRSIIAGGFTPEGLLELDSYAEQFIRGKLVYKRFSPQEQYGCSAGGSTNVIASLLAGAKAGSNPQNQGTRSDYQRECQLGAQQESVIHFFQSPNSHTSKATTKDIYLSDMHDDIL